MLYVCTHVKVYVYMYVCIIRYGFVKYENPYISEMKSAQIH